MYFPLNFYRRDRARDNFSHYVKLLDCSKSCECSILWCCGRQSFSCDWAHRLRTFTAETLGARSATKYSFRRSTCPCSRGKIKGEARGQMPLIQISFLVSDFWVAEKILRRTTCPSLVAVLDSLLLCCFLIQTEGKVKIPKIY